MVADHFSEFGLDREVPGAEVHVHAVGQEVVAAGVGGGGADEDRTGAWFELLVCGEEFLVGRQAEIRRERVEPVLGAVNLGERLDALAAAGQEIGMVIGILTEGEAPLAKVAGALGGAGFGLGAAQSGQEEGRQERDDGDDDQQLDQRERCAGARSGHPWRLRRHLTPRRRAAPVASRRREPGSGTAVTVRSGRKPVVPKLRESKR